MATRAKVLGIACALLAGAGLVIVHSALAAKSVLQDRAGMQLPQGRDDAERERRLAEKGMAAGSPMMIRIFKAESELEVWMLKEGRFELFTSYQICHWSGALGPKLNEGDKQSPEGLYSIGSKQLHTTGRWPRSLDIGFPNNFDRAYGRTGSYILVHGGCTSTGCYAMTNPVIEELYSLSEQALRHGQERIPVHVFPFRMTDENLAVHAGSPWSGFWSNLKEAYDVFERTRIPPRVSVCNKSYVVGEGTLEPEPATRGRIARFARVMVHGSLASAGACRPADAEFVAEAPARRKYARRTTRRFGMARRMVSKYRVASKYRRLASRYRYRRYAGGRNTRRAYAAARVARMSAYAKRMRTSYASGRGHR